MRFSGFFFASQERPNPVKERKREGKRGGIPKKLKIWSSEELKIVASQRRYLGKFKKNSLTMASNML
jgi:hypothetical protein